uniref:Nucleoprotein n=1 Tax=Zeugodacus cucurbitae sigmavirus-A3 TaxID=3159478 RepID=A0AAU7L0E6_9RHAB
MEYKPNLFIISSLDSKMEGNTLYAGVIDFTTEKPIQAKETSFETPLEYPSDHFTKHPGKPKIAITVTTQNDLTVRASNAYGFVMGSKVPAMTVCEFLYYYFESIRNGATDSSWVSYGVTVNHPSVAWDFVTVQTTAVADLAYSIDNPISPKKEDFPFLAILIAGFYRYSIAHREHKAKIAERVSALLANVPNSCGMESNVGARSSNSDAMAESKEVLFLLSAIDLYLDLHQPLGLVSMRVGTIITKYQGCAAFSDLLYFQKLLGFKYLPECALWFFSRLLFDEFRRVTGNLADEYDSRESYFPYMMGLQLSSKSPYAVSSNQALHMVIHIVGALFGNQRSYNAVRFDLQQPYDLCMNACIIFFAHVGNADLTLNAIEADKLTEIKAGESQKVKAGETTAAEDGPQYSHEWYYHYKERGFKLSKSEVHYLEIRVSKINLPRDGSVGKYLKEGFIDLMKTSMLES